MQRTNKTIIKKYIIREERWCEQCIISFLSPDRVLKRLEHWIEIVNLIKKGILFDLKIFINNHSYYWLI